MEDSLNLVSAIELEIQSLGAKALKRLVLEGRIGILGVLGYYLRPLSLGIDLCLWIFSSWDGYLSSSLLANTPHQLGGSSQADKSSVLSKVCRTQGGDASFELGC